LVGGRRATTRWPYKNWRLTAGLRLFIIMGDKSPKMKNKQAAQKQAKANSAAKQKNDSKAAKSVVKPKR